MARSGASVDGDGPGMTQRTAKRLNDRLYKANRKIAYDRAGGRCEACHRPLHDFEAHHRRYRSRGLDHSVGNLLILCHDLDWHGCRVHHAIHTDPDYDSLGRGYQISQWDTRLPSEIPVTLWDGRRVYLTAAGYVDAADAA